MGAWLTGLSRTLGEYGAGVGAGQQFQEQLQYQDIQNKLAQQQLQAGQLELQRQKQLPEVLKRLFGPQGEALAQLGDTGTKMAIQEMMDRMDRKRQSNSIRQQAADAWNTGDKDRSARLMQMADMIDAGVPFAGAGQVTGAVADPLKEISTWLADQQKQQILNDKYAKDHAAWLAQKESHDRYGIGTDPGPEPQPPSSINIPSPRTAPPTGPTLPEKYAPPAGGGGLPPPTRVKAVAPDYTATLGGGMPTGPITKEEAALSAELRKRLQMAGERDIDVKRALAAMGLREGAVGTTPPPFIGPPAPTPAGRIVPAAATTSIGAPAITPTPTAVATPSPVPTPTDLANVSMGELEKLQKAEYKPLAGAAQTELKLRLKKLPNPRQQAFLDQMTGAFQNVKNLENDVATLPKVSAPQMLILAYAYKGLGARGVPTIWQKWFTDVGAAYWGLYNAGRAAGQTGQSGGMKLMERVGDHFPTANQKFWPDTPEAAVGKMRELISNPDTAALLKERDAILQRQFEAMNGKDKIFLTPEEEAIKNRYTTP